jgi:hypothetical protein
VLIFNVVCTVDPLKIRPSRFGNPSDNRLLSRLQVTPPLGAKELSSIETKMLRNSVCGFMVLEERRAPVDS